MIGLDPTSNRQNQTPSIKTKLINYTKITAVALGALTASVLMSPAIAIGFLACLALSQQPWAQKKAEQIKGFALNLFKAGDQSEQNCSLSQDSSLQGSLSQGSLPKDILSKKIVEYFSNRKDLIIEGFLIDQPINDWIDQLVGLQPKIHQAKLVKEELDGNKITIAKPYQESGTSFLFHITIDISKENSGIEIKFNGGS